MRDGAAARGGFGEVGVRGQGHGRFRAQVAVDQQVPHAGQGRLQFLQQASWRAYDHYLRANRVREGVRSYSEVVNLILRTRFDEGWTPVRRDAGSARRESEGARPQLSPSAALNVLHKQRGHAYPEKLVEQLAPGGRLVAPVEDGEQRLEAKRAKAKETVVEEPAPGLIESFLRFAGFL